MIQPDPLSPTSWSIIDFRQRVLSILQNQASSAQFRNLIIFAVDGIPYELAAQCWTHGVVDRMLSVFPTTSSTAWLSSLSGMTVHAHGVPGVVFRLGDHGDELINVFDSNAQLFPGTMTNIFSDAAGLGYVPLSILGDLADLNCSWRDLLLSHSVVSTGSQFYAEGRGSAMLDPTVLSDRLESAIAQSLASDAAVGPCLVWCFIDADMYVHHHGYDCHISECLVAIEQLAVKLANQGMIVIAHSDHGLTPTRHDADIEYLINLVSRQYECSLGGAGRVRWLYSGDRARNGDLKGELIRRLPCSISVLDADELFVQGSLSRRRVGDIVLVAGAEEFLSRAGYAFDHGSVTENEIGVPFAKWET